MINLHFSARQKEILEKLDEKIKNIELNKNSLMRLISLYKIESNYEIQDSSLAPYMGVKIQHSDKMIKAFKDTIDDDTDTVCDTFLGMGGSITALNNVMKRFKIKNLILGDFNPTTLNLHKNVAENTEELIDAFIEVYRTINLKDGNIFKPAQETLDSLKNTLTVLEKSGQHSNVYASALFMFIQPLQFGGGYDSRLDENNNLVSKLSSKVIGYPMYFRTIFNSIHKFRKYAKMYNSYDTVFLNEDYSVIVDNLKGKDNVLFLFDPPYYDTKVQYHKKNKKDKGFNQEKLLNKLPSLKFIYTNYKVRDIYDFSNKFNFRIDEKIRTNKISGTDEVKTEYFITSNNVGYKKNNLQQEYEVFDLC